LAREQSFYVLILSRSCHIRLGSQMGEKCGDLSFRHFGRVTFAMEKNESLDPIAIRLLRSDAVVFAPDYFPDLIE